MFGDGSWNAIGLVETQDNARGPVLVTMNLGSFIDGLSRLEFWKAKAFGVHTNVANYYFDPAQYAGLTLNFSWLSD